MTVDLTPEQAAYHLYVRRRARRSLLTFIEYTHARWETGQHHVEMCRWCDLIVSGEPCPCHGKPVRRMAFFAPPRHSKTEIVGRRLPAYYLGRHPERQIIYGTAVDVLGHDVGAAVRDIVASPECRAVFPGLELKQDSRAAGRWMTTQGGSGFFTGVGGTVIGRGAHLAILDDLHGGRNKADSIRERDIVHNWYSGDIRQRLMRPETIVMMFTRWNLDDLAGRLLPPQQEWVQLDERGWVWQAGQWHVVMMQAIQDEGTDHETALWPGQADPEDEVSEDGILSGYPLPYLRELRAEYQETGKTRDWSAQYQQRPVVEEGSYLRRQWFEERWDALPDGVRVYLTTDFAVTERTASNDPDRTEILAVALAPDDRVYVIDAESMVTTADVWVERLLDMIKRHGPFAVFGEKGVIRRAVEPMIRRRMEERKIWARLEWMPTTRDKLARGRAFQNWAANGRVIFPRRAPWVAGMVDELVAINGGGRYDDKFDALAHFFMAIDQLHPAIISAPESQKTVDGWSEVGYEDEESGWRLV